MSVANALALGGGRSVSEDIAGGLLPSSVDNEMVIYKFYPVDCGYSSISYCSDLLLGESAFNQMLSNHLMQLFVDLLSLWLPASWCLV